MRQVQKSILERIILLKKVFCMNEVGACGCSCLWWSIGLLIHKVVLVAQGTEDKDMAEIPLHHYTETLINFPFLCVVGRDVMEVAKEIVATVTDPHTMVGPEVGPSSLCSRLKTKT